LLRSHRPAIPTARGHAQRPEHPRPSQRLLLGERLGDGGAQLGGQGDWPESFFKMRLATNGNMQWDATPTDKLTIHHQTLLAPNDSAGNSTAAGGYDSSGDMTPGPMTNVDPSQSYSWKMFGYKGAYSGPTDTASLDASTNLDTSGFLNLHAGRFDLVLNQSAQEMDLVFTPTAVPEPGTLALVGLAGIGLGWADRRRRVAK
jgi:hypothetical protein